MSVYTYQRAQAGRSSVPGLLACCMRALELDEYLGHQFMRKVRAFFGARMNPSSNDEMYSMMDLARIEYL